MIYVTKHTVENESMQLAFPTPKTFIIGIEIYYLQHSKKSIQHLLVKSTVRKFVLCGSSWALWSNRQALVGNAGHWASEWFPKNEKELGMRISRFMIPINKSCIFSDMKHLRVHYHCIWCDEKRNGKCLAP